MIKQATVKINNDWLYALIGQNIHEQMVKDEQIEPGEEVQLRLQFEKVPFDIDFEPFVKSLEKLIKRTAL